MMAFTGPGCDIRSVQCRVTLKQVEVVQYSKRLLFKSFETISTTEHYAKTANARMIEAKVIAGLMNDATEKKIVFEDIEVGWFQDGSATWRAIGTGWYWGDQP